MTLIGNLYIGLRQIYSIGEQYYESNTKKRLVAQVRPGRIH
jgi:hypothetical protein